MGPTASGKTSLAEALAQELDAQLVNADAFQVYRGLDIGTAKPVHGQKYALLDIKKPDEGFAVGEFILRALPVIEASFAAGKAVVLVGGTGLYLRALMEEYKDLGAAPDPNVRARLDAMSHAERVDEFLRLAPESALRIDMKNPVRVQRALERLASGSTSLVWQLPRCRKAKFALEVEPSVLEQRIGERVRIMLENGWLQEVSNLRDQGYTPVHPGFRAIGYSTLFNHLEGEFSIAEVETLTIAETRAYAKRQRTWLRTEPNLTWLEAAASDVHLRQALLSLQ